MTFLSVPSAIGITNTTIGTTNGSFPKSWRLMEEWNLGHMTVWRTNWEEATNMDPLHSVSHYLEFQRQLAASKGSSRKPLVDVPADRQLNSLREGRAPVGLGAIDQAEMKPPGGGNSVTPLEICEVLAAASEKMNFERPDTDSLRVERIKAGLTEIAWAFLLLAGLATFGLACLLSPTFLT